MYPPQAFSKKKRYSRRKATKITGEDMERRYASAGPNKVMYEMYSQSLRNTVQPDSVASQHAYGVQSENFAPNLENTNDERTEEPAGVTSVDNLPQLD